MQNNAGSRWKHCQALRLILTPCERPLFVMVLQASVLPVLYNVRMSEKSMPLGMHIRMPKGGRQAVGANTF